MSIVGFLYFLFRNERSLCTHCLCLKMAAAVLYSEILKGQFAVCVDLIVAVYTLSAHLCYFPYAFHS